MPTARCAPLPLAQVPPQRRVTAPGMPRTHSTRLPTLYVGQPTNHWRPQRPEPPVLCLLSSAELSGALSFAHMLAVVSRVSLVGPHLQR